MTPKIHDARQKEARGANCSDYILVTDHTGSTAVLYVMGDGRAYKLATAEVPTWVQDRIRELDADALERHREEATLPNELCADMRGGW